MNFRFTLNALAVFTSIFICSGTFAQNAEQKKAIVEGYDLKLLKNMASTFDKQFQKDQKEAMEYAKTHGIPFVVRKENGGVAILQRILPDGSPLYYTTTNRGASITTRTNELYSGGDLNIAVHGEGMEIGVWDGGLVLDSHELISGRVVQNDAATVISDHATHVTGTLIGSDIPQNGNARGMAFQANALAYSYDNDLAEITNAAASGMLVSNHSYGFSAETLANWYFGAYINKSATIDQIAYSAPFYTIVKAAGNDRNDGYNEIDNGYDLLTDFAVSKNVITVAAVQQVNNYTGPNSVQMSSFSSYGPTDDGRIKPDISGKGVNVYSAVANSNSSYSNFSGTSMACPNVAGSLLLLQQLNNNLYDSFLRSATIKALAIHTASEAGSNDGPDYRFGWGLLDMESAARVLIERGFRSDVEENTLANNGTYTKTIEASGNDPIVVTLSWTDPAGNPLNGSEDNASPRLVNDLDIRVEDEDGNIFYPWKLDVNNFTGAATQGDNVVDNVEKIEIGGVPQGNYTITVSHKGTLTNGAQDYSLVVTGFQEGVFALTPEFLETTVCDFEDASIGFGFISEEGYTGPTNLSVTGLPADANATFSPSVLTEDGSFVLDITDLEGTATGVYPLTITAAGPGFSQDIDINLTVVNAAPLDDITVTYPGDGDDNVFIYPTFTWTSSPNAQFYEFEISTDPDFETVLISDYPEETSYSIPGLQPLTQYYYRVRPASECGEGNFVMGSFTTEDLNCEAPISATDTPKNISFIAGTTTSTLTVPESEEDYLISDVNVTIAATHSHVADLTLVLTSPAGTQVTLISAACGNGDNIDATFDDTGSTFQCASTTPVIYGTYEPLEPLSNFIGEDPAGEWTLSVIDEVSGDGGFLNEFTLEICQSGTASVQNQEEISSLNVYPNPSQGFFNVSFSDAGKDINIDVLDMNGRRIISKSYENQVSLFNERIETSMLSQGVYFVEINNGGKKAVKKLIVN